MKKKLIISVLSVLVVGMLLCLPYWINDVACSVYREEIVDGIEDVSGINILQVVNACGNSSGKGNHTDLYVAILVETSLTETDIKNEIVNISSVHDVEKNGHSTLVMEIMNLNFNEETFNSNQNCYILEFSKESPCSIFDMRGH